MAHGQAIIDNINDTVEAKGQALVEEDVKGAVGAVIMKMLNQSELGRHATHTMLLFKEYKANRGNPLSPNLDQ